MPLELIDVHTHPFPSAQRGLGWQRSIGHADTGRDGTPHELLRLMNEAGVSHAVALLYTPTRYLFEAKLQKAIAARDPRDRQQLEHDLKRDAVEKLVAHNEWGCAQGREHRELLPFVGLDPVYMTAEELTAEMDDKRQKGARGIKIVPEALAIYGNDERLYPVYEKLSDLRMPMLSQAGGGGGLRKPGQPDDWGRPRYFAEVLETFPELTLLLAHMGMGYEEDVISLCRKYPNVYPDLSSRLHTLDTPGSDSTTQLVELIRECGAEHVMFGTNYPLNDPKSDALVLQNLPLSQTELELIASGNAKRVLSLS